MCLSFGSPRPLVSVQNTIRPSCRRNLTQKSEATQASRACASHSEVRTSLPAFIPARRTGKGQERAGPRGKEMSDASCPHRKPSKGRKTGGVCVCVCVCVCLYSAPASPAASVSPHKAKLPDGKRCESSATLGWGHEAGSLSHIILSLPAFDARRLWYERAVDAPLSFQETQLLRLVFFLLTTRCPAF